MKRTVQKAIPNRELNEKNLLPFIRDIIAPVLRECRAMLNARFGEITTVTETTYYIGDFEEIVLIDTEDAASIYLPKTKSIVRTIIIKNLGKGALIYPDPDDSSDGMLIDGNTFATLDDAYDVLHVATNGAQWYVLHSESI